ncbi:peptidase U32 family protein [Marinicrinis lubricantis]|uniref:Peptidase U32 family protein n=1 Tax=Marinicrinis lubricantis TaxID=2086470 RepID=A0ABW1IVZ2_9BACL
MRTKPELLATAGSLEEIDAVLDAGADAVSIGEQTYGLRMPGALSILDIKQAIDKAHARGAKAYVSVNNLYENHMLEGLKHYIEQLVEWKADAIVFGDPSVMVSLQELGMSIPLHWNPEMTATNYATARFWQKKGASRVVLARELNLQEIHEVKQNLPDMEVQVQIHGMTNMYHSNRYLLQNYFEHHGRKVTSEEIGPERQLYLVERERPELQIPVYEDASGTHIMSADDICLLEALDELFEVDLDSVKIDGLLKPLEYHTTVIRTYREAIDAYYENPEAYQFHPEWLERIQALQDPNRELSFGFLFKEQVY